MNLLSLGGGRAPRATARNQVAVSSETRRRGPLGRVLHNLASPKRARRGTQRAVNYAEARNAYPAIASNMGKVVKSDRFHPAVSERLPGNSFSQTGAGPSIVSA